MDWITGLTFELNVCTTRPPPIQCAELGHMFDASVWIIDIAVKQEHKMTSFKKNDVIMHSCHETKPKDAACIQLWELLSLRDLEKYRIFK